MPNLTPAEELEALKNKCALLGASLRQADAEIERLKAKGETEPRLSDVLAPAFANAREAEINSALHLSGQLSGRDLPWTDPGAEVTINREDYSRLHGMLHGLSAIAALSQIVRGVDDGGAESAPWLLCGLDCAMVALSGSADDMLDGLALKAR
jgi:hypothetical protein